jgi:hypothetical protein
MVTLLTSPRTVAPYQTLREGVVNSKDIVRVSRSTKDENL